MMEQVASRQEEEKLVETLIEEEKLVETLSGELERVTERMERHFSRREAHEAASSYVKALLSATERKNTWVCPSNLVVFSRYDTEPSQGSRRIRGHFISF